MSLITDLSERFRALFRRAHADRELDEEMAFHLDRDIADRIARGADPREARRHALIAIGGVDQAKEAVREARGIQPLEDLVTDVRHAIRALGANPGLPLTVILVLGGALGAAIAVFAVADSTLMSDGRYGVSDRLVRIYQSNSPTNRWSLSSVDALALLEQQKSFDAVGLARRTDVALSGAGAPERTEAGWGTSGFFIAAGARVEAGRTITPSDELDSAPAVALVSHAFAAERFGGHSAVYADGKARAAFWQRFEDRAREMPGISAAGLGADVPPDDPEDVNNFDLIDRPARGGAEPTAPWLDRSGRRLCDCRRPARRAWRVRPHVLRCPPGAPRNRRAARARRHAGGHDDDGCDAGRAVRDRRLGGGRRARRAGRPVAVIVVVRHPRRR